MGTGYAGEGAGAGLESGQLAQSCLILCDPMDCTQSGQDSKERVAISPAVTLADVDDASPGPDPSSKATLWVKAQHEGALPPPGIVRKDPRVPHTARRGA